MIDALCLLFGVGSGVVSGTQDGHEGPRMEMSIRKLEVSECCEQPAKGAPVPPIATRLLPYDSLHSRQWGTLQ